MQSHGRKKEGIVLGGLAAAVGTILGLLLLGNAPWLSDRTSVVVAGIFMMTFFPALYLVRRDPELRRALPIPVGWGAVVVIGGLIGGIESPYVSLQIALTLIIAFPLSGYTFWLLARELRLYRREA